MLNPRRITTAATALALIGVVASASADEKQAAIEDALRAAPEQITEDATVMTMEGEVLREGEGAYTCMPGVEDGPGPMCLDEEWMRWADAWMNKKEFTPSRMAIAYMLSGDMPGGGASNIDPFATEPTADNQWVVEGPHLMVIGPDPVTEGMTTDPDTGGPYVMWEGTPYEHIMVPVAPRPE